MLLFTNVNRNHGENVSNSTVYVYFGAERSVFCIKLYQNKIVSAMISQFQTTFIYVLVFSHWLIMLCVTCAHDLVTRVHDVLTCEHD